MDEKVIRYKRKFDRALKHIKILFMVQRRILPTDKWEEFVISTKSAIIADPNEFFCFELPSHEITLAAIDKVFEGFYKDIKTRDSQPRMHTIIENAITA